MGSSTSSSTRSRAAPSASAIATSCSGERARLGRLATTRAKAPSTKARSAAERSKASTYGRCSAAMARIRSASRTRRRSSSRARWRVRSPPRATAATTAPSVAGLPFRAWLPAEPKRSPPSSGKLPSSRQANASAVGERQMLPVQTNSTVKPASSAPPPSQLGSGAIAQRLPERALDLLGRDRARAQQAGPRARQVDDRGGRAGRGRAGVEEHVDVVAELRDDPGHGCLGGLAEAVGTGHRERPGAADERQGEALLGHAHRHRATRVAEVPADPGRLAQHDRERAGPPGGHQRLGLLGEVLDQADGLAPAVHQHRQRQVAAAPLDGEQGVDRRAVEGVAADAVDGVGRQHDHAAARDHLAADLEQPVPEGLVLAHLDHAWLAGQAVLARAPLPRRRLGPAVVAAAGSGRAGGLVDRGAALLLAHGRTPSTTRWRPARSWCRRTSLSPAAASAWVAALPWSSAISLSSTPPEASQRGASAATRRSTSSPSGPPSRASRGSWSRTSRGSSSIWSLGT